MEYRINPKNKDRLSALGFGCMRMPKNEREAEKLIISAVEQGINYFDTAYFYFGNEAMLGRILQRNGLREKVKIATKMPQYLVKKPGDLDRFFAIELERLQTDHIEYYLMHTLNSIEQWRRLVSYGVEEWIQEKKAAGQIGSIGFSYHGGREDFRRIVDAYPWDFCMIQYNYMDECNQAGKEGLLYAGEQGMAVMVMEPLLGGRLAIGLPEEAHTLLKRANPDRAPAEWGLRWVWNHPQVITVLSGMDTQEILDHNVRVAGVSSPNSLSGEELVLFEEVRRIIRDKTKVPCTGCAYCMPCPFGVDIPLCFNCYNETAIASTLQAQVKYVTYVGDHGASQCQKCGKCEEHCPQSISIQETLKIAAKTLERFPYRQVRALVRWWLGRKQPKQRASSH